MELKIIDFATRAELESFIRAELGTDQNANRVAEHKIVGNRLQLKKLFLSDQSTVFGVRVVVLESASSKSTKTLLTEKKGK